MKNVFASKIILTALALGIVAIAGISKASYSNPTAAYPGGNTDAPIDTSLTNQTKNIGTTTDTAGGLSVEQFISQGNAQFDQDATFNGDIHTDTLPSTTDTVQIGGDTIANGDVHAVEHLNSQTLTNSTGTKTLCADATGNIIFCD